MESQARSVTGSSEALDLVSRRRPTASRGQTYALSAEAVQVRKGSGEVWVTPVQRGSPDGGYSHPVHSASVQAHVGTSLVSEAAFDAALASKDPATVQRAFDKFYAFRQRMEMEQEAAIRANVAQTFQRLGLPAPASDYLSMNTASIRALSNRIAPFSGRILACSVTSSACNGARICSTGDRISTWLCQRPSSRTTFDGLVL